MAPSNALNFTHGVHDRRARLVMDHVDSCESGVKDIPEYSCDAGARVGATVVESLGQAHADP